MTTRREQLAETHTWFIVRSAGIEALAVGTPGTLRQVTFYVTRRGSGTYRGVLPNGILPDMDRRRVHALLGPPAVSSDSEDAWHLERSSLSVVFNPPGEAIESVSCYLREHP